MVTMNGYLFALILSLLGLLIVVAWIVGGEQSEWGQGTRDFWDGLLFILGLGSAGVTFVCLLNLVLAGAGVITL